MIRHFLYKLGIIILPVALLVCLFNYFVDPANVFSSKKYVAGISLILSSGHNVDNISNYNERLLQEQMIKRLNKAPDIIILGSSRIMEIGSDFFPGKIVLNCGVSHANIRDIVSLIGLLDSLGKLPSEIFINVDPDLICEGGSSEWQDLSGYYGNFLNKYFSQKNRGKDSYIENETQKLYSIISFAYFKKSVDFFVMGTSKKYYDIGEQHPRLHGRFSDGTICYPFTYTHPDTFKVASDAWNTGIKTGLSQPDTEKMYLLNAVIDFLEMKRIKLNFIMLPFHPKYYEAVNSTHSSLFNRYENLFLALAARRHIPIVGSFNSRQLHIDQSAFYDMYHCSKNAIQKIGLKE